MAQTPKWWKEEVIYQIYPMSFQDSNADGIGDIQGIISRLDYLQSLGITMIWMSPFYESPNDDNGYDISNYTAIGKDYGTMEDFEELLAQAKKRGIKVLVDTVFNHSSDEHAWFQESKKGKDNPYRDYYIWKPGKNGGPPNNWQSFFEGSAWQYDEASGEYYLHLFTVKQPDLNWENPKVRQEVADVCKFWLDKGVAGFRMDVIPLISKQQDYPDADNSIRFEDMVEVTYSNGPRVHEFLHELNQEVFSKYECMTMAEGIGITDKQAALYIDEDRKELDSLYHFDHLFLDHGPGGRFDVRKWKLSELKAVLDKWDKAVGDKGWFCFSMGNHDFGRIVNRYGSEAYREKSAKLLSTLILGMRATPIIYQGDEIGMVNTNIRSMDDVDDVMTRNAYKAWKGNGLDEAEFMKAAQLQSRDHARTPMQWDNTAHAGFTKGAPWLKINMKYESINVAAAQKEADSVLDYYIRMIQLRKSDKTFVYGEYVSLLQDHEQLFAFHRKGEDTSYLFVLNMSDEQVRADLDVPANFEVVMNNYDSMICCDGCDCIELRPWEAVVLKTDTK
ncbi:MAG: alpha-glucosidase [Saprospiraceae bacterium]|nr:alpha-glucosidase [Saprospiraceae bacterium]